MKLRTKLAAGAVALAAMLGAAQASQAAIIDWTLSNGTFDDGGTFAGTFRFDTVTDTITNWNVSTAFGDGSSGVYSSPGGCVFLFFICSAALDSGSGPNFSESFFIFGANFELTNIPLAAGAGSVAHLTGDETTFDPFNGPRSHSVSDGQAVGVLSAAPEPAGWALMILGSGLAGATLRLRRRLALA